MYFHDKISTFWWLKNSRYFMYFVRELSGVVIVLYVLFLFYTGIRPGVCDFSSLCDSINLIAFLFAVLHSVTWLYVTAKIFHPRIAKKTIPSMLVFILLLLLWIVVSFFTLAYFYRFPLSF